MSKQDLAEVLGSIAFLALLGALILLMHSL
jgi:hypothetical protein